MRRSSFCCRSDSLGCLPLSLPRARATAMPSRVRSRIRSASNSAKVARMLKNIFPIGSAGSIDARPERELDAAHHERVSDGASIRDRARQAIEFGHDERVAGAHGRKRLVETGAGAVRAGEPAIHVDALGRDAELFKSGPLGGEVLLISGAAGVADQGCGHGDKCTLGLPSVIASAYHLCETLAPLGLAVSARAGRTVRWPIPLRP